MLGEFSREWSKIKSLKLDDKPGNELRVLCEGKYCVVFDHNGQSLDYWAVNLEVFTAVAGELNGHPSRDGDFSIDTQGDKVGILVADESGAFYAKVGSKVEMTYGFDLDTDYELLASVEVYDLDRFLFIYTDEHVS